MKKKTALITGVTGQDGYYLSKYLLEKGYRVVGGYFGGEFDAKDFKGVELISLNLKNKEDIDKAFELANPDEVYNLASHSFIPYSWENPEAVIDINGLGVLRILEKIRNEYPNARLFSATSSEMFGDPVKSPQNENTSMLPKAPYGASKVLARTLVINYRNKYGIYGCNGIMYNHESTRRDESFVTQKIITGVKYIAGLSKRNPIGAQGDKIVSDDGKLHLGNLDAKRDWGFAGDYVKAMHAILQQPTPEDYIIATGKPHSVKEFVKEAFKYVGIDNWKDHVVVDEKYWRPNEKIVLTGDNSKLKKIIDFNIQIDLKDLIKIMFKG